jgi:hypothetical protein
MPDSESSKENKQIKLYFNKYEQNKNSENEKSKKI